MGARFFRKLTLATSAIVSFAWGTASLSGAQAQERPASASLADAGPPPQQIDDPSSDHDPFDASVPAVDGAAPTDPSMGPDPFLRANTNQDANASPNPNGNMNADGASPTRTPTPTPTRTRTPLAEHLPSPAPSPADVALPHSSGARAPEELVWASKHGTLKMTLLLQPQLAWEFFNAAASPNLLPDGTLPPSVGPNATYGMPDGTTTNRGTFRLRRARVGFELTTKTIMGAAAELDPNLADRHNPASGTVVRRLELTGQGGSARHRTEVGAGVIRIPFSRDLAEANGDRIFVERAHGTRAMFPEDADMGVRVRRTYAPLGLDMHLAVLNGVTVGEPSFGRAPDLNKTKDASGRIAIDVSRFAVGLGGYAGQGQVIDAESRRVLQRTRAAIVLDALFRMRLATFLRETRLSGEVVVGRSLDRGVLTPFVTQLPTTPGVALATFDSRSAWIRLEQDFRGATLGFRYDAYTPDASERNDSRHTVAVAVSRAIGRNARLSMEYDHSIDQIHAPGAPLRTRLIELVSVMAQLRY